MIFFRRQELIEYYRILTEEMDRREERAQWKIKRLELNKRRLEFFAQEQVNLEKLQKDSAKDLTKSDEEVSSGSLQTVVADIASQPSERASVQVPSPSIVSLIASGIRTDAMIQSEFNKSTAPSSAADSGVETDKGNSVVEGDVSEGHTLHSLASLDEADDTDTSIASTVSAPASRKKWSTSADVKPVDLKTEQKSKRRMWDDENSDNVQLAESPFPHGHPSESSIQFSLYAEKKINDDITESTVVQPSIQTNTSNPPNPSDSNIQNIMYPSGSAMIQGDSNKNNDSHNTESTDKDNSIIQESLKSDEPPEDDPVIRDFVRSLSLGVSELRNQPSHSLGHPSDSTAQTVLYVGQKSPSTYPPLRTNQLSAYSDDGETFSGRRSAYGHPSDSQLDTSHFERNQSTGHSRKQWGHPSDSHWDSTVSESNRGQTTSGRKSAYGHPSDAQLDSSGTYLSGSALSIQTPTGRRSPFGHPSDAQLDSSGAHSQAPAAQEQTPKGRRSPYGHPSDTRLDSTDSKPQNTSGYPTRHLWGHPSDSKVQHLLISSVSEEKQPLKKVTSSYDSNVLYPLTTRGTPPIDSIKDVIYPEHGHQEKLKQSSRGHEPAVKITKLMYPDEQKTGKIMI